MRWQLRGDPELRRKVWPDYTFGCKRILFSSHLLPALRRPERRPGDRRDRRPGARGRRHRRRDARTRSTASSTARASGRTTSCSRWRSPAPAAARCATTWADGAHAHLGMTVPGFPNLFVLYGPNTNTSGGSIIAYLEAQAAYVRQALARGAPARRGRDRRAPGGRGRRATRRCRRASAGTAWTRCDSWYRTPDGRIVANWPGYMREYFDRVAQLDPADFAFLSSKVDGEGLEAGHGDEGHRRGRRAAPA